MTTWIPLESNPEVFTKYIHRLGVSPLWSLTDIFGLEPEQLEWVIKPVKAVILLCNEEIIGKLSEQQEAELKSNPPSIPSDLFYMKQYIDNACGAIALIHGIANNPDIDIENGSILKNYIDAARELTPEERGKLLENDALFTEAHQALAVEGQTDANPAEVKHHYVVFVNYNNQLYELDGSKSFPIKHGETSAETLLEDAAKVCKSIMARDPDDGYFSVIALGPTLF